MVQLTNRQLRIVYFLLNSDNIVVTSEQIAEFASSSVRTIKSEIPLINHALDNDGIITISSNHAKGYYVEIRNKEKFPYYDAVVRSKYSFSRTVGVEKMDRRLYIMQRLFSSSYVKLEMLADELYMTKTALKEDMEHCREFFASYDICVAATPGKGLYIVGKEDDIRMCMVETFSSQYHYLDGMLEVPAFERLFYEDIEDYQTIRHHFLKIIRESYYSMSDVNSKKIATYLAMLRKRITSGKQIDVDVSEETKNTYEWELVKEIFNHPWSTEIQPIDKKEMAYVAILLICYRDYNFTNNKDLETSNKRYLNQVVQDMAQIVSIIKNGFGSSLYALEIFNRYETHILSTLYPLYFKKIYASTKRKQLATYYEVTNQDYSPVAMHMARNMMLGTQKVFACQMDSTSIFVFIILFDIIFKRVNYTYKKRRLALSSISGKMVANEYSTFIKNRFGGYIDYIHIFNLYEMRRVDFSDYDAGLCDGDMLINIYPIDIYKFRFLGFEDSTLPLFQDVFRNGFSRKVVNDLITMTRTFENFECNNYHMAFKLLSFCYGNQQASKLEDMLHTYEEVYSFYNYNSHIAVVFCDYEITKSTFVHMYTGNTRMLWDKEAEVKYLIVISLPNDMPIVELKTMNNIIYALANNTTYCEDMYHDVSITYNEIFDKIITNHFLRIV